MNTIGRNILAVVIGLFVGSLVNQGFVILGEKLIPLPDGVDVSNLESLKASIGKFSASNFIFPFLAHATGTLVGAFLAAKIAFNQPKKLSLTVGALFFLGGLYMVYLISGPIWFTILDLGFAYIPMALLGFKISRKTK